MSFTIKIALSSTDYSTLVSEELTFIKASTKLVGTISNLSIAIGDLLTLYPENVEFEPSISYLSNVVTNSTVMELYLNEVADNLQEVKTIQEFLIQGYYNTLTISNTMYDVNIVDKDINTIADNLNTNKTVGSLAVEVLALSKIDNEIKNLNNHTLEIYELHQQLPELLNLARSIQTLYPITQMNPTTLDWLYNNDTVLKTIIEYKEDIRKLSCSIDILRTLDLSALDKLSIQKIERVYNIDNNVIQLEFPPSGDLGRIELIEELSDGSYIVKSIITDKGYTYYKDYKMVQIDNSMSIPSTYKALVNYVTIQESGI